MAYVVFAQSDEPRLPLGRLVSQARAHFAGVLTEVAAAPKDRDPARLAYESHDERGEFSISIRPIADVDVAAARAVDTGAGLADLASRCKTTWVVESSEGAPEWLVLECCALLASIALGPVFDANRARLLGVRSARELADGIRGGERLMR